MIDAEHLARGAGRRPERPLLVVDLGVPRNVDPAAGPSTGSPCSTWTHLRSSVAQAMEERRGEAAPARAIVAEEVARYRAASRARGAAPVVAALRARLEELRTAELSAGGAQFGRALPEAAGRRSTP